MTSTDDTVKDQVTGKDQDAGPATEARDDAVPKGDASIGRTDADPFEQPNEGMEEVGRITSNPLNEDEDAPQNKGARSDKNKMFMNRLLGGNPQSEAYREYLEHQINLDKAKLVVDLKKDKFIIPFLDGSEIRVGPFMGREVIILHMPKASNFLGVGFGKRTLPMDQHAEHLAMIAISRGWQSLAVNGKPEFRDQMWLAALNKGLDVTNYSPGPNSDIAQKLKGINPEAYQTYLDKISPPTPEELQARKDLKVDALKEEMRRQKDQPAPVAEEPPAPASSFMKPEAAAPNAAEAAAQATKGPTASKIAGTKLAITDAPAKKTAANNDIIEGEFKVIDTPKAIAGPKGAAKPADDGKPKQITDESSKPKRLPPPPKP